MYHSTLLTAEGTHKAQRANAKSQNTMPPQKTATATTASAMPATTFPCSLPSLFLTFTLLSLLSISLFFFSSFSFPTPQNTLQSQHPTLKVYLSDLPRSLNYGLLDQYWSTSPPDSRISSDPDHDPAIRPNLAKFPRYPENPLIKQYSAEYWITGDLMTPETERAQSAAKRVFDFREADVVFVPFFATLSAEMELGKGKGTFRKKEGNEDYERQRKVVDIVKNTEAWKRSGGKDHVFVLTGNVFSFTFLFGDVLVMIVTFVAKRWFKLQTLWPVAD